MPDIILLTGKVNYTITLDPTSWIFDDRKVDLSTYFDNPVSDEEDEKEEEWLVRKNSLRPPVKKRKRKFSREELLSGSFGVPLKPFLENAEVQEDAATISIETTEGKTYEIALDAAKKAILGFSKNGKFLSDGPAHFYFGDGSNRQHPITGVKKIVVQ